MPFVLAKMMNSNIVLYIALAITGFVLGHIGDKSIPYAWAECVPSKTIDLELVEVSSENGFSESETASETNRWPTKAHLTNSAFTAVVLDFYLIIPKKEK